MSAGDSRLTTTALMPPASAGSFVARRGRDRGVDAARGSRADNKDDNGALKDVPERESGSCAQDDILSGILEGAIVKEGMLEKKVVSSIVSWAKRKAFMTKDVLYFTEPGWWEVWWAERRVQSAIQHTRRDMCD